MAAASADDILAQWPDESREAAELVIDQYGQPDEMTASWLVWQAPGPWKRMTVSKVYNHHEFPIPHTDSVASFIDYYVPPDTASDILRFDGSVTIDRTAGEVWARCGDEEANFLALNLMHDIVTGARTPDDARAYYGKEFLDVRRGKPTPYMEGLRFEPALGSAADPDERILRDEDLEQAAAEAEG